MKRLIIISLICIFGMVIGIGMVFAGQFIGDDVQGAVRVSFECASDNIVRVRIPLLTDQYTKEGLLNPKWQVYCRTAWQDDNGDWHLNTTSAGYGVVTICKEVGYLVADVSFDVSRKRTRFRIWIPSVSHQNVWAWINKGDPMAREDSKGNLAYEFAFENDTPCKGFPIPSTWTAWPAPDQIRWVAVPGAGCCPEKK